MRRLTKSVLVGGVVYPAGAHGAEVEAAVTNRSLWDDYDPNAAGPADDDQASPDLAAVPDTDESSEWGTDEPETPAEDDPDVGKGAPETPVAPEKPRRARKTAGTKES